MDEALWAAYRRRDKAEVMDCLFGRSLVGIGFREEVSLQGVETVESR
jgi:hypothetical protein